MDFLQFVDAIVNARFGFPEIFAAIGTFFTWLASDPNISLIWDTLMQGISFILPYISLVLLLFYIIIAAFGKRLFSLLRFLAFFVAGFALGIYFLAPLINAVIQNLPPWVIGIVIGIVSAVLSKIFYFLALAVAAGYSVYILIFRGMIFPSFMTFATGNYWVALLFAVAVTVLIFLFRKYVEMIGTSLLGGLGIAFVIRGWWDYTTLSFLVGIEWVGIVSVMLIFAIIGFIIQFKTRVRY